MPEIKTIENGLRKAYNTTLSRKIIMRYRIRRVGFAGNNVYVGKRVEFQRNPSRIRIADNVIIKDGCIICPTNPQAEIKIGQNSTLGYYSMIFASLSIIIGDNCMIAPFCYFVDANHGTEPGSLMNQQPLTAMPISIGNDVWIGVGARLLPGITIGDGCVIGAGSVVTKSFPQKSIIGGVPAREIGKR